MLRHVLALADLPDLPAPPRHALRPRKVIVVNGDDAHRASLADAVSRCGGVLVPWPCTDGARADADVIIDLGVCGTDEVVAGAWRQAMHQTVELLQAVYDVWAAEADARRRHYVAVTRMGGSMCVVPDAARPSDQPLGGLWAGLAKTLPREFPACNVHVVDLARDVADPGTAVLTEMLAGRLLETGVSAAGRRTVLPRESTLQGPRIDLGPQDTILMSGGGRGIGFALAEHLARRYGCHVIVSGRSPRPVADEVLGMSEQEFSEYARRSYSAQPSEGPQAVRARLSRLRRERLLLGNLQRIERTGLDIEYVAADIGDAAAAARLVAAAGDGLSVVVHNAGIDEPKRLDRKTVEGVERVIAIKLDGLLHLVGALQGRTLKMLCSVGSLTGRYGGMPGQLDYAAANEAIARTTTWLSSRLPYPVKTLAWPTWNDLGLITNLEAAARFMRPIGVEEGLDAWAAELTTGGRGEVGYMGEIGVVDHQHVNGLPIPSNWSGRGDFLTKRLLLGDVTAIQPGRRLDSQHRVCTSTATCVQEFRVGAKPAVPVTWLLEHVLFGATWLLPPDAPGVQSLSDIRVDLRALAMDRPDWTFRRQVRVVRGSDGWSASVDLLAPGATETTVLSAVALTTAASVPRSEGSGEGQPGDVHVPRSYRWQCSPLKIGQSRVIDDTSVTRVAELTPSEAFALLDPPQLRLPFAHLEAVLELVGATRDAGPVATPILRIGSLRLHAERGRAESVEISAGAAHARVLDDAERVLLEVDGLAWESDGLGGAQSRPTPALVGHAVDKVGGVL